MRNTIGPFLDGQAATPLHVTVVGGAGTGKSTVVNLLTGTTAAEANSQAGYTRHPTPFPWFVLAMAVFLAAAAAWLKWGRWPRAGATARREGARLNAVPLKVFVPVTA